MMNTMQKQINAISHANPDEHGKVGHLRLLAFESIAEWHSSQTAIPHSGSYPGRM